MAIVVFSLLSPSMAFANFFAGFAEVPLPVKIGDSLGGYGGTHRVGKDFFGRPVVSGLVLSDGFLQVAICSIDILIARPRIRQRVQWYFRRDPFDALLIAATHTHSGPGGYLEGTLAELFTGAPFEKSLEGRLVQTCKTSLQIARDDLRPASVSTGEYELQLSENRRVYDQGILGGRDEKKVPILQFEVEGGSPIVLFSYGSHPIIMSDKTSSHSGDYVAMAREYLKDRGIRPIFLSGPLGDQRPRSQLGELWSGNAAFCKEQTKEVGRKLGRFVWSHLNKLSPTSGALEVREAKFPRPKFHLGFPWKLPGFRGFSKKFFSKEVFFQWIRIGDSEIFAVPAEPTAGVGDQIRGLAENAESRFVLAHANDWMGYVLESEDHEKGGYEAKISFFGKDFARWIYDRFAELLEI